MAKPDAYLVGKGRTFADTVYIKQEYAEERVTARKDGSILIPLFAIDEEAREGLKLMKQLMTHGIVAPGDDAKILRTVERLLSGN